MVKRASGVTSYYARVQPANPAARIRRIERKVDLVGQAITALVIAVGALVLIYNVGRWLCGY